MVKVAGQLVTCDSDMDLALQNRTSVLADSVAFSTSVLLAPFALLSRLSPIR